MAFSLKTGLPISVAQVLGPEWRGGALVQLEDTITRPSSEDLILNHCWVKPFVQRFRDRVPSSFFITDVFLMLDKIFSVGGTTLLCPLEEGDTKQSLAGNEAKKVKLLIGALRGLWRSSSLAPYFSVLFGGVCFCDRTHQDFGS